GTVDASGRAWVIRMERRVGPRTPRGSAPARRRCRSGRSRPAPRYAGTPWTACTGEAPASTALQLQMLPLRAERLNVPLSAPAQVRPQVRRRVLTGKAREPGQVGRDCQGQPWVDGRSGFPDAGPHA